MRRAGPRGTLLPLVPIDRVQERNGGFASEGRHQHSPTGGLGRGSHDLLESRRSRYRATLATSSRGCCEVVSADSFRVPRSSSRDEVPAYKEARYSRSRRTSSGTVTSCSQSFTTDCSRTCAELSPMDVAATLRACFPRQRRQKSGVSRMAT
jgi:hypothetical protein